MFHSSVLVAFGKGTLATMGIAMMATMPMLANAAVLESSSKSLNSPLLNESLHQSTVNDLNSRTQFSGLIADKDDHKGHGRDDDDRDHKNRKVRVDLNRAKNLARQAAESANGGIRVYRAENSMHGPAAQCPYVDRGDFWVFTFLGGRPGVTTMTTESVVTVYKNSPRVVVDYNGPIRSVQQTQVLTFTSTQRTVLIDLLRGNCSCNALLSDSLRTQITSQSRSLPPGIQKQLRRGKGLPPGIAKKLVRLPKQVNTHVNLPTSYDLVVIGSDVLLLDQVNYVVVDWIANAF